MRNTPFVFTAALLLLPFTARGNESGPCYDAVQAAVQANLAKLSQAGDKSKFCPGASGDDQACFTALGKAVIKLESGGNPSKHFKEPKGKPSEGCMQMSEGECPEGSLTDPQANVKCGIRRMGELIAQHHNICQGQDQGACKYWSVLRPPYSAFGMNLGKQEQVIQLTQQNIQTAILEKNQKAIVLAKEEKKTGLEVPGAALFSRLFREVGFFFFVETAEAKE